MIKNRFIKKYEKIILMVMVPLNLMLWTLLFQESKLQYQTYLAKVNGSTLLKSPRTQAEYVVQLFMKEFEADATRRGIEIDLTGSSFSFSNNLGREESSLAEHENLTILATCVRMQSHIVYRSDLVYDLLEFRSTVYHELGHCVFGLSHDESAQTFPVIMKAEHEVNWNDIFNFDGPQKWELAKDHLFNEIKAAQNFKKFSKLKF